MTPTEQALARELARHPAWRWAPGILAICGKRLERVVWTANDGQGLLCGTDATGPEHYPDLSDPATQGCLIAMLGEAFRGLRRPKIYNEDRASWTVDMNRDGVPYHMDSVVGTSPGVALARAWLAVNHE